MKSYFTVLFLPLALNTFGQFNAGYDYYDETPVIHDLDTLINPWAGGLNNPQFSSIDVDLDGTMDVFIFERDGKRRLPFIRNENGEFEFEPSAIGNFPKMNWNYTLLRDYDEDGKSDIFTAGYNNYGIDVYRNISDTILKFEQAADDLMYKRESASALFFYAPINDLPAIYDFDGDGDLDILIQGQVDLTPYVLLYVKNLSQELYGTSDSLAYKLVNKCWGKVREYISETGWTPYACDTGAAYERGKRHGGTTLAAMDLNNDGLNDLITGDSYRGNLISLINIEDNEDAVVNLALSDTAFPSNSVPAEVPTLPAVYLEDMDLDGVKDMMVSPNQLNSQASFSIDTSINMEVDWYFRNAGTNSNPTFELEEKGFFSSEMIDVGSRAFPSLVDFNGDGLLDLMIGNEGYNVYGGTASASITAYLNVGSEGNPSFELYEKDVAGISSLGFHTAHPCLADIDDDGDVDLLVGDEEGNLHYFKNTGVASIYNFQLNQPMYENIDVGLGAHPTFFDLNIDGLQDLVIGDYYGRIHYYENIGTSTDPSYSQNATIEEMGGILNFNTYGGASVPYFTYNLDSLGTNLYLMQGTGKGQILIYGPITNIFGNFEAVDSIVVEATYTSIVGADLFGDQRDELIIGQRTGGLYMLNKVNNITIGLAEHSSTKGKLEAFPNPSDGTFTIKRIDAENQLYTLNAYDVGGRKLFSESANASNGILETQINLSAYPDGLYFVSLEHQHHSDWIRLIKK